MLKMIRTISLRSNFAGAPRSAKVLRFAGRIVFLLYVGLFVSDTINIDVLTAALKGDITFVDDSSISDSLFDTGSAHHSSAFDSPSHSISRQEVVTRDAHHITSDNIVKNIITEDEDSPGIADALLSSSFAEQSELPRPESEFTVVDPAIQILDRTISYQRILI